MMMNQQHPSSEELFDNTLEMVKLLSLKEHHAQQQKQQEALVAFYRQQNAQLMQMLTASHSQGLLVNLPQPQLAPSATTSVFVFVDNSNTMIGAQNLPQGGQDKSIRLNVDKLANVLEGGRQCSVRHVTGSDKLCPVWRFWRNRDYTTHIAQEAGGKEEGVDASIHSIVTKTIHRKDIKPSPQTVLVLATGDGNRDSGMITFPELAEMAAERGWAVEIWAWSKSLSGEFKTLAAKYPSQIKLKSLDPFREEITWKQAQKPASLPRDVQPVAVNPFKQQPVMAPKPAHVPVQQKPVSPPRPVVHAQPVQPVAVNPFKQQPVMALKPKPAPVSPPRPVVHAQPVQPVAVNPFKQQSVMALKPKLAPVPVQRPVVPVQPVAVNPFKQQSVKLPKPVPVHRTPRGPILAYDPAIVSVVMHQPRE